MFTAAAAGAFAAAVSAIVSAGTAVVFAVAAIAAISAAVAFSAKVMTAAKECFAFSAGKNFRRFFIKPKAGGSVAALFKSAMVTNKVTVGNFLSAFAGNGDAVRNKIMSLSAVFTSAFMFHWQKPFQ